MSITDADLSSFKYFFEEKGDFRRWCDWEEKKLLFFKRFPELFRLIRQKDQIDKLIVEQINNMVSDEIETK